MKNTILSTLIILFICGCASNQEKPSDMREMASNHVIENNRFFDYGIIPQIIKRPVEYSIIVKNNGHSICENFKGQKVALINPTYIYQNSHRIRNKEKEFFDTKMIKENHYLAYKMSLKDKPELAKRAKEILLKQLQLESNRLYESLLKDISFVAEPIAKQSNILMAFDNDKVNVEYLNCLYVSNITNQVLAAINSLDTP